ncbi:hypothetical protein DB347_02370 [Opitutaceae bacterium EW11]|nr:hypothetical protein DB347_02370 [Opitutaceae bacterium EW11]
MDLRGASAALPGFKLKQVTDWIETHLDEEFDLDSLAAKADLSKFHFHRLFKQATGLSPAKFQLDARMKEARRRLRETNMPLLTYIKEISPRPILFIHGEKAHSRYFSETAYTAAAEPKELLIIPGASHVDLYDRMDKIPFERIAAFCAEHLK